MRCPSCGYVQMEDSHCKQCGTKVQWDQGHMKREGVAPARPTSRPPEQPAPQPAKPDQTNTWLTTQADEISQGLLAGASRSLTHLKTNIEPDKKLDPSEEWEVVAEYMFFLLHVCDRTASGALSPADRAAFMDLLAALSLKRFAEALASATGDTTKAGGFYEEALRALNTRQREYANYKAEPGEGEGLGGTLLGEFGKRIAQLMGFHPLSASVNYTAVTLAIACLKALELKKRLASPSQPSQSPTTPNAERSMNRALALLVRYVFWYAVYGIAIMVMAIPLALGMATVPAVALGMILAAGVVGGVYYLVNRLD